MTTFYEGHIKPKMIKHPDYIRQVAAINILKSKLQELNEARINWESDYTMRTMYPSSAD
jgi:hypothetical protein